jgi:hypothetical protein
MGRYDTYNKKNWDKAKYKPINFTNDVINVANDTTNICNTLYDIASEITKMKYQIDSYNFDRKADYIANQTGNIKSTFVSVSNNSVKHLKKVVGNLSRSNAELSYDVRKTNSKLDYVDRLLERYM